MISYLCIYIPYLLIDIDSHYNIFDVRTKLNNYILRYYDLKCEYDIKPIQIDCHILQSSNVLFQSAIKL